MAWTLERWAVPVTRRIRWVANLSLLFVEEGPLDRPAAAAAEGFTEVECWWPFGANASPTPSQVAAFTRSIERSGTQLTAMNLFGGPPGARGVVSDPSHTDAFRHSVGIAMAIGRRLGTRLFNAPFGNRIAVLKPHVQADTARENLAFAARAAAEIGATIMIEPLSDLEPGMPEFPLRTARDAVRVIDGLRDEAGISNVGLLLDQYHLMVNGADVVAEIDRYGDYVRHVQVADVPGRGEPGSGHADIAAVISALLSRGYEGAVALEYVPRRTTRESLLTWRRTLAHIT